MQWYRERVDMSFRPEWPRWLLDVPWRAKMRDLTTQPRRYERGAGVVGDELVHEAFGIGFVESRRHDRIVVLFESGTRTLML